MTQMTQETYFRERSLGSGSQRSYVASSSNNETSGGVSFLQLVPRKEPEVEVLRAIQTQNVGGVTTERVIGNAIELANETTGSTDVVSETISSFLVSVANQVIQQVTNRQVALDAKYILATIEETVIGISRNEGEIFSLTPLSAIVLEDGSVLIEWVFGEFRVGFTVEPEAEESGWHLISSPRLGQIAAAGYLSPKNKRAMISWLTYFVMAMHGRIDD